MSSEKQSSTRKVANRERGAQIRRLRESLGKTPSEFAQGFLGRAGKAMTSQAVWNWENGVNPPSAENYIRMGNTAPDVEQKLHFWEAAGVEVKQLKQLLPEADGQIAKAARKTA
jgi:transcriptional regulator with XRE-family HTH domain